MPTVRAEPCPSLIGYDGPYLHHLCGTRPDAVPAEHPADTEADTEPDLRIEWADEEAAPDTLRCPESVLPPSRQPVPVTMAKGRRRYGSGPRSYVCAWCGVSATTYVATRTTCSMKCAGAWRSARRKLPDTLPAREPPPHHDQA